MNNTPQTQTGEGNAPRKPTYNELVNALLKIRRNARFCRDNSTNRGLKEFCTLVDADTEIAKVAFNAQQAEQANP